MSTLGGIHTFDVRVMEFLADHRTPELDWVARRAMSLGSPLALLVGVVVLAAWSGRTRRWADGAGVLVAAVGAIAVAHAAKAFAGRDRPPTELAIVPADGTAFPSTAVAITTAVVLVLLLRVAWPSTRARVPATLVGIGLVLVSSWAVMYLGAHWFTDVVAGFAVGVFVGFGTGSAVAVASAAVAVAAATIRPRAGSGPTPT